jgi:hypothetical protein
MVIPLQPARMLNHKCLVKVINSEVASLYTRSCQALLVFLVTRFLSFWLLFRQATKCCTYYCIHDHFCVHSNSWVCVVNHSSY